MKMMKRNKNRTAAVTVEVAFCLPILILLLFGFYELARANLMLHATQSAAYEGARVGIVPGATFEEIEQSAGFILRTMGVSEFTVETVPAVIQSDTEFIQVNIRVPVDSNLTIPRLFVRDGTFEGSCTLTREIP